MTTKDLQLTAARRRAEIYQLYLQYRSYDKVAIVLKISRQTVCRIVRRYLSGDDRPCDRSPVKPEPVSGS